MEPVLIKKKYFTRLFQISLVIKEIDAFIEILGGALIWFTSKAVLVTFILDIFKNELSDNPKDVFANFIVNSASDFSVSSQYFLGAYLFLHGLIKIFLIINLFNKKLWAYPVTIIVFSIFIIYQLYIFNISHSLWTLTFSMFDILIVLLAGHEYGVLLKAKKHEKVL
jgi:uncharacterized membrane protein